MRCSARVTADDQLRPLFRKRMRFRLSDVFDADDPQFLSDRDDVADLVAEWELRMGVSVSRRSVRRMKFTELIDHLIPDWLARRELNDASLAYDEWPT